MRLNLLRGVAFLAGASLVVPVPAYAQAPPQPPGQQSTPAEPMTYNIEQLDAMLAPIALYPDTLLTQVLMASTYPLEIVAASRWLQEGDNKSLTGDALAKALESQNWDPSVKSLVPFPQVLSMLDSNLDWTQQLGYAFANQQDAVWNSVQRLRAQAQAAGQLESTEQQIVTVENNAIVIQPANPEVVYVPVYNPTVVYGAWPYPSYPPVYYPPPPGYVYGSALVTGLAFATGVAIVGSLWGWCRPAWHGGYGAWGGNVYINHNRYNNININRPPLPPGGWRPPPPGGPGGRPGRPPNGPVGRPGRPVQLPANAIGRPNVGVPGNLVSPRPQPSRPGGGNVQRPGAPGRTPGGGTAQRPGGRPGGGPQQRPATPGRTPNVQGPGGQLGGGPQQRPATPGKTPNVQGPGARPGGGPQQRPAAPGNRGPSAAQRPSNAFNGVSQGNRAAQYGQRGAQSRNIQQQRAGGGAARSAPRSGGGRSAGGGRRR